MRHDGGPNGALHGLARDGSCVCACRARRAESHLTMQFDDEPVPGFSLPILPGHVSPGRLERLLRAGVFSVTTELSPPDSADPEDVYLRARVFDGYVDAINATDGSGANCHMSSVGVCSLLTRVGYATVGRKRAREVSLTSAPIDDGYLLDTRSLDEHEGAGIHAQQPQRTALNVFGPKVKRHTHKWRTLVHKPCELQVFARPRFWPSQMRCVTVSGVT